MAKQTMCGNKWIQLMQDEYGSVTVKMDDGVALVPVNAKNEVLMISEPSLAYDGLRSYLLPTGGIEPGEDPAECANRELQEEMGLKANKLDELGVIYLSIKYVEQKSTVFLARDFEASLLEGDEPEGWIEKLEPVSLADIEKLISEGKLLNGGTIAALYMARSFIERNS